MTVSAHFGEPPATQDDYWVVKGMMQSAHLTLDPAKGMKALPPRPPPDQYHFESLGPTIIARCSVAIFFMVLITGMRLGLRLFKKELRFGADDWLIIPAAV